MLKKENNFAYIDGANLYKGVEDSGWNLDYKRLRLWLNNKYKIKRAYIFLGLVAGYGNLYTHLQEVGFNLIFKETTFDDEGKVKGNCDADLVLQAACDSYENKFSKAVIISSDGDYASLIKFLQNRNKLLAIISPSNHCSILLKRTNARIIYLDWVKNKVNKK